MDSYNCIRFDKNKAPANQLIIIHQWQIEACDGNQCAAALLSYLLFVHNNKIDKGVDPLQWHTAKELEKSILLFKERTIVKAIKLLVRLGFISIQPNPNPAYKFDKTRFFLVDVQAVHRYLEIAYPNSFVAESIEMAHLVKMPIDVVKMPIDVVKMPIDVVKMPIDVVKMPIDVVKMPEQLHSIQQSIQHSILPECNTDNPDAHASEKNPLAEKEPETEPAKNPDKSVEQENVPLVVCDMTNELQPVPPTPAAPPRRERDIYFDKRQWEPYREMFNEHKPHIWGKVNCLTEPRITALQSLYRDYGEDLLLTFKEALDAAKLDKWTNTRSMSFEGFCKQIPALSEKNQVLRGQRSEKVEQVAEQARTIEGAFAPKNNDAPTLYLVRTW